MDARSRKAASDAFKERKVAAGIYTLTCAPTRMLWVGRTANLGMIWNRVLFELRQGCCRTRTLQAAWIAHPQPEHWHVQERERLDDDTPPYLRDSILKERLDHWSTALGGRRIV